MHSKLLKLLLDPKESHGQDKLFLSIFLNELGIKNPDIGVWQITAEEGKIDVLLRRDNPLSIVVIENKSNRAVDQLNQLYRYWHKVIYHSTKEIDEKFYCDNENYFQIVYLAPNNKYYEMQTVVRPDNFSKKLPDRIPMKIKVLTFNEFVVKWISSCIAGLHSENYRMKEYLIQYQEICKLL